MSENFEDLLRDHYRRAADGIQPDKELIDRCRSAGRPARVLPARVLPVRPSMLLAAAAVALTALLTWGLLRPGHRSVPVAPPTSPAGRTPIPVTPTPTKMYRPTSPPVFEKPPGGGLTRTPIPSPTRPVPDPPVRPSAPTTSPSPATTTSPASRPTA